MPIRKLIKTFLRVAAKKALLWKGNWQIWKSKGNIRKPIYINMLNNYQKPEHYMIVSKEKPDFGPKKKKKPYVGYIIYLRILT